MRDLASSLTSWAAAIGKWWWSAVVGVALGAVALFTAIQQLHKYLPWVGDIVLLVALVASFLRYHHERAEGGEQAEVPHGAYRKAISAGVANATGIEQVFLDQV
jgi:hypothetical protein